MLAHRGFYMENKSKEIRKRLLDLERDKKIEILRERFAQNNLLGSGIESGEVARVEIEYRLKKDLIDQEESQAPKPKKPIFKKSTKYLELWKLEQIFNKVDFETYPKIAIAIGNIKAVAQFRPSNKKHILKVKETFNKYSKKEWGLILKANKNKLLDGLLLIATK